MSLNLIIWYRDILLDTDGCPNVIRDAAWGIGDLFIFDIRSSSLDGFVYLDEPTRKAPMVERLKRNVVTNSFEGSGGFIGERFYCHEGKWLVYRTEPDDRH